MDMGGEELASQEADVVEVYPLAVDDRILPEGALDLEAEFFDHAEDGRVVGANMGPDLIDPQCFKAPLEQNRVDLRTKPFAPEILFADHTITLSGLVPAVDIDQAGNADGHAVQGLDHEICSVIVR